MRVKLTPDQDQCLRELHWGAAKLHTEEEGVRLADLARLKARCEEFLTFPLIQALNPERFR
jgi:hypothetical protein